VLDAFGDRVRRVVEERRHHGERSGHAEFRQRGLALEPRLEADVTGALPHPRRDRSEHALSRPTAPRAAEKHEIDSVEKRRVEGLERGQEEADPFPFS
jgi:hypothetical protein